MKTVSAYYEFFAGGGMARSGLGPSWQCLFANDFDHKKGAIYRRNWRDETMHVADVRRVQARDLPGRADLIWASFPCQDLSLAGGGAGLRGDRSGTFWPFWDVVKSLIKLGRAPQIIALENVCGTLTSHGGKDFAAICMALDAAGYSFGAMVIDAALFTPHSRPRLFIVGLCPDLQPPLFVQRESPSEIWHTRALRTSYEKLAAPLKQGWVWWDMPMPAPRVRTFADLVEDEPVGITWHTAEETRQLLAMMSNVNAEKVREAKRLSKQTGRRMVGTVYKRTRRDENGYKVQRAEIRFDDIAGCLRTPAGGSSRQLIVVIDGGKVRSRLISPRETARLMGLPDHYVLPDNYNEAYHLTGDGVAAPVVRHLARHIFEPLLAAGPAISRAAA